MQKNQTLLYDIDEKTEAECLSYLLRASQYKSVQDNLSQQTLTKTFTLCKTLCWSYKEKLTLLCRAHKLVKCTIQSKATIQITNAKRKEKLISFTFSEI